MIKDFGTLSYRPNKESPTRIVARYHTPMYAFSLWQGLPKVQSKSFPIMQQRAAEDWLRKAEYEIEERIWVPPQEVKRREAAKTITFDAYFPDWLEQRRFRGNPLKASTKYHNEGYYRNHISPVLGDKPISEITAQDVHDFRESLDPSQPDMIRCTMKVLRAMIHSAMKPGLDGTPPLLTTNPLIESEPNVVRKREIEPGTENEIRLIYEAMPERYALSVYIAALVGLRIGEVCALKVSDIELRSHRLRVERTRSTTPNALEPTTSPKTERSTRTEPIPSELVPMIREHVKTFNLTDSDWLFPSTLKHDEPIRTTMLRKYYTNAKKRSGVRMSLNFHALRHTCLTWLAQSGATVKELMDMAGHSDPKIAMIYQHAADERRREQAEALGGRLFGES